MGKQGKKIKQNLKHQIKTSITKEKNQGCDIFGSCYIKNITNKESPEWLKNKEREIGKSYFKSISEKAIDISITPNRADCLGVRGIARDLSSAGVGKLIPIKGKKIKQNSKHRIKTSITKEKNCCMLFVVFKY